MLISYLCSFLVRYLSHLVIRVIPLTGNCIFSVPLKQWTCLLVKIVNSLNMCSTANDKYFVAMLNLKLPLIWVHCLHMWHITLTFFDLLLFNICFICFVRGFFAHTASVVDLHKSSLFMTRTVNRVIAKTEYFVTLR